MNDETIMALLVTLKLQGMLEAYGEQLQHTKHMELCFDERLGLLLDREMLAKQQRRVDNHIKRAKLRHQASIGFNYRHREKRHSESHAVLNVDTIGF